MKLRKILAASTISAALLAATASPALAQSALRPGAVVTGPQGGEVGTITSVDGEFVVLRTDRHEVRLPVASFTATADAILFGVTREQLNSDLDRMKAEAQQAIAVGATVRDRDGALIGPVEATDSETLTVRLGEQLIRLPRTAVAPGSDGLVIGATVAELQAEAAAAAPATE